VIKLDDGRPLDRAALVSCGVTTGYLSAVRTGETRVGDAVVVVGVGGGGINALQGARMALRAKALRSTPSNSFPLLGRSDHLPQSAWRSELPP
jgi:Zn-dependent alcohol dehydrogenase